MFRDKSYFHERCIYFVYSGIGYSFCVALMGLTNRQIELIYYCSPEYTHGDTIILV